MGNNICRCLNRCITPQSDQENCHHLKCSRCIRCISPTFEGPAPALGNRLNPRFSALCWQALLSEQLSFQQEWVNFAASTFLPCRRQFYTFANNELSHFPGTLSPFLGNFFSRTAFTDSNLCVAHSEKKCKKFMNFCVRDQTAINKINDLRFKIKWIVPNSCCKILTIYIEIIV